MRIIKAFSPSDSILAGVRGGWGWGGGGGGGVGGGLLQVRASVTNFQH